MRPQPVAVLGEPVTQQIPGPYKRLVRDLDDPVVGGDQAFVHQPCQGHPSRTAFVGQFVLADPAAHRLAALVHPDQPEQQPPGRLPLVGVEGVVRPLGRIGHRVPDSAGRPVASTRVMQRPSPCAQVARSACASSGRDPAS